MGRRIYNREFKLEAVKLVAERGVALVQAARDYLAKQMEKYFFSGGADVAAGYVQPSQPSQK